MGLLYLHKQRRYLNCDSDTAGVWRSFLDAALRHRTLVWKGAGGTARRQLMAVDLPSDFSGPKPIQSNELQRKAWWNSTAGLVEFAGPALP
jgi:hypothetical protein